MPDRLEPILPQVPVEGLRIHIGRSALSMGDAAEVRLLADGQVGVFARVRRRWAGLVPVRRDTCIGHLGPIAAGIVAPALLEGAPLRLRVVSLTPEHLAGSGPPEAFVSIWGDPRWLAPWLQVPGMFQPPQDGEPASEEPPPPRKGRRMRPALDHGS